MPDLHLLFEHGDSLWVIEHELIFLVLALSSFGCYLALFRSQRKSDRLESDRNVKTNENG